MMRRPGAGGASTARDRAQGVIRGLSDSDPSAQLAALNQLLDMINTGTEETLASLRPDSVLPAVVQIMQASAALHPDITLLATRVLTYFIDAIQGCAHVVAACGGVDVLANMLLEIRDIELAEQAIVALDKIGNENPAVLLQNSRGPEAFLLFVDFFAAAVQRRAVTAVANLSRRATPSTFHRFVPILQQLRNMIVHDDDKISEAALTALSRIVAGVGNDAVKVQAVMEDAIPAFVEALEGKHIALAAKLLADGAQSPKIAGALVDSGIVTVVAKLLGGGLVRATPQVTPAVTPQLNAAGVPLSEQGGLAPLSLNDAALGAPAADNGATAAAASSSSASAASGVVRPETALDLITIVLRLLPEVRSSDHMLYMTEGCCFYDTRGSSRADGSGAAGAAARNLAARMMDLPAGMPPELHETFRRMLEATGHNAGGGDNDDDDGGNPFGGDEDDEERSRSGSTNSADGAIDTSSGAFSPESIAEAARDTRITIAPADRWSSRRPNVHSCDPCGKHRLAFNDWFRSNERDDYDMCRTCFVRALRPSNRAAFVGRHGSTFTDMMHFSTTPNRAAATARTPAPGTATAGGGASSSSSSSAAAAADAASRTGLINRAPDPRLEMLKESPYILLRVAEGMSSIVKYRMNSEDATLHARVLDLISRVVEHLDGDQIRHFFLEVPLTTILAKTLSANEDTMLGQHVVALTVSKVLLKKMEKTILPYFFRNGLSRALTVRSTQASGDGGASPASASAALSAFASPPPPPVSTLMSNPRGRKTFVGLLAQELNRQYFANAPNSKTFDAFARAAKALVDEAARPAGQRSQAVWDAAVELLVARFGGCDESGAELPIVSAHEMDDSRMLEGLVAWLRGTAKDADPNLNPTLASKSPAATREIAENLERGMVQAVQLVSCLFQKQGSSQQDRLTNTATALLGRSPPRTPPMTPSRVEEDGTSSSSAASPLAAAAMLASPLTPGSANASPSLRSTHLVVHSSALHRLVGVLQDMVADCDKFDPSNVRVRRQRDGFELRLTREGPMPNEIGGAPGGAAATASAPSRPGAAGPAASALAAAASANRDLRVSIDRQATVGAIEDYLRGNVYHVPRRGPPPQQHRGDEHDGEDQVEELLPAAPGSQQQQQSQLQQGRSLGGAGGSGAAGGSNSGAQPVYMRIGQHLLSSNMTMNDVVNKYLGGADFDPAATPLHLHHSLQPFTKLLDSDAANAQAVSAARNTALRQIYGDTTASGGIITHHRIVVEYRRALLNKMQVESAGVPTEGAVIRAMRLLRVINAVNGHIDSLRCYVRMSAAPRCTSGSALPQFLSFAAGNCTGTAVATDDEANGPGLRFANSNLLSKRLQAKVDKVLASPSSVGCLRDSWCVAVAVDCPFLLPLDTRIGILELGFLGPSRGAVRHAERYSNAGPGGNSAANAAGLGFLARGGGGSGGPRLARKKFRVWRDPQRVLECASELFKRGPDGGTDAVLEFEFYGEVGSGLGPTLEFYSLACEALQLRMRGLFRHDASADDNSTSSSSSNTTVETKQDGANNNNNSNNNNPGRFCRAAHGHYFAVNDDKATRPPTDLARTLGGLLTRCLMDRRVGNIFLSPALVRLFKGDTLVFDDVCSVLPVSAVNSLMDIYASSFRGGLLSSSGDNMPGVNVGDLCLAFELPFQPRGSKPVELRPGGAEIDVTAGNCKEYAEAVVERVLGDESIREMVAEARVPLVTVLEAPALRLFEPHEMSAVWKGLDKVTSYSDFAQHIAFDHGFTAAHPTAKLLLEVLSELSPEDQRCFYRWLTGSPSLPVGGLGALRPRFTCVRKLASENEQQQLPSVMTCQNYLKLPAYENKEMLRGKLLQAIHEGAGAFLFT